MELSWAQMERHFRGDLPKGRIVFSTGTHVVKDLELQRNVKRKVPYFAIRYEGLNDFISEPATPEIIAAHPQEFAVYEQQIERGNIEPYDGYGEVDNEHCELLQAVK